MICQKINHLKETVKTMKMKQLIKISFKVNLRRRNCEYNINFNIYLKFKIYKIFLLNYLIFVFVYLAVYFRSAIKKYGV